MADMRVGQGLDFHRFAGGRQLVLGGVKLDAEFGLDGHSDADVVLHALMDALLGAAGMGDIGMLFPDTDHRFKDADSGLLTAHVMALISEKGFRPVNADITVIGETPRVGPYREQIRRTIAGLLHLPKAQVNVKATTTETMGFLGRKEGLGCLAVVLLSK